MENIADVLRIVSDMQRFSSDDCRLLRIFEDVCGDELSCADLEMVSAAATASYRSFEALLDIRGVSHTE